MTELVVRRLLIDLETPFARHWCGGDAFRSALFNALSMSFPVGEQFFIDAVRDGHKALPPPNSRSLPTRCAALSGKRPPPAASMHCSTATSTSRASPMNGPRVRKSA